MKTTILKFFLLLALTLPGLAFANKERPITINTDHVEWAGIIGLESEIEVIEVTMRPAGDDLQRTGSIVQLRYNPNLKENQLLNELVAAKVLIVAGGNMDKSIDLRLRIRQPNGEVQELTIWDSRSQVWKINRSSDGMMEIEYVVEKVERA